MSNSSSPAAPGRWSVGESRQPEDLGAVWPQLEGEPDSSGFCFLVFY